MLTRLAVFASVVCIAASLAHAQSTCGCVPQTGDCNIAIEDPNTPGVCDLGRIKCNPCRCVAPGESPQFECDTVQTTAFSFDGETENSCSRVFVSIPVCPDREPEGEESTSPTTSVPTTPAPTSGPSPPGTFEVSCGASQGYSSSYVCTIPMAETGSFESLSCRMDIQWNSNYSASFNNDGAVRVVTSVTTSEERKMAVKSATDGYLDITDLFSFVSGDPWNTYGRTTALDLMPEEKTRLTSVQPASSAVYQSTVAFQDSLNAGYGALGGANNVNLLIAYASAFTSTSLTVNIAGKFSDYRVITCTYT